MPSVECGPSTDSDSEEAELTFNIQLSSQLIIVPKYIFPSFFLAKIGKESYFNSALQEKKVLTIGGGCVAGLRTGPGGGTAGSWLPLPLNRLPVLSGGTTSIIVFAGRLPTGVDEFSKTSCVEAPFMSV